MRTGDKNILGNLQAPKTNQLMDNVLLNAFDIAINGSLTRHGMVDGIRDAFVDESGVDTGGSTNEVYDAVNDLYSNDSLPAGYGANTKLLLHCNGADTSTTFTDSSPTPHTVTANGNAQVDTGNKKWGTGALILDGTGDYLSIPDSTDWECMSDADDDWTYDLWIYFDDLSGGSALQYFWQYGDDTGANSYVVWFAYATGATKFQVAKSGTGVIVELLTATGLLANTTWYHLAVCKVGNDWGLYIDGTQVASDSNTTLMTGNIGSAFIGTRMNPTTGLAVTGAIDEFRIDNENRFSATPSAGNDTITVPTAEYAPASETIYDMTLLSNSVTAEVEPDNSRLVIFQEDVDAVTINTDIKGWVSKDGGSTWAQVTLIDEGTYDTNRNILVGTADLTASGIGAGVSMEYKITTHNSKEQKIHGIGMLWD